MKSRKTTDIVQFVVLIVALVVINVIMQNTVYRADLTADKRYSVDEQTIETLDKLPGIVRVEVFLDGDMPASYAQLQRGIKDKLQDLNSYSDGKIDVEFIDPFSQPDSLKPRIFDFFKRIGLKPVTVQKQEEGKISSKALFPGAVLTYQGNSVAVNLLKKDKIQQQGTEIGELSRNEIEHSLNEIEFEFTEGLKMIALERKKKIAFITGHGELTLPELKDVEQAFAPYYQLYMYNLDTVKQTTINELDMIVMARPKSKLSDLDKYKIDQFLMQGGNLVCFIDALEVRPDEAGLIAKPYDLNMRDLLFAYGVRLNDEIILDLSSTLVAVEVDGNQKLTPSTYTPRIINFNKGHKITKDLQALSAIEFIGSLDTTTSAKGVTKTPLFFSSQYTRKWQAPVTITGYDITHPVLEKETYTEENLPLAYLLEGDFKSFFKNKPVPQGADVATRKDKSEGLGKVLVVGDGEFVANKQSADGRSYKPVGYSAYEQRAYQNMAFFNNTVDYMLGHDFITNKTQKFIARPLDKIKIKEEKEQWQVINLVVPNLIVVLIGLVIAFIRKNKYAKF